MDVLTVTDRTDAPEPVQAPTMPPYCHLDDFRRAWNNLAREGRTLRGIDRQHAPDLYVIQFNHLQRVAWATRYLATQLSPADLAWVERHVGPWRAALAKLRKGEA